MHFNKYFFLLLSFVLTAFTSVFAEGGKSSAGIVADEHAGIGLVDVKNPAGICTTHPDAQWYPEAGLGLFLHWSISSVKSMNISWPMIPGKNLRGKHITDPAERERMIREKDFELNGKPWGPTPNEYWAMAADFNPGNYDPEKWCAAAKAAGFTYVVLTVRHHDGFALWPSAFGDFSTKNFMGGRDLVKPYVEACRNHGLKVGLYYSPPNWHFERDFKDFFSYARQRTPEFPALDADLKPRTETKSPEEIAAHQKAYDAMVRGQVEELLANYGKIDLLWFDGCQPTPNGARSISAERIRELQPGIVINPRLHGTGDFITYERELKTHKIATTWAEFCNTWALLWTYDTRPFRSNAFVLGQLALCRSLGINYLLGIGPDGQGEFHPKAFQNMAVIAEWMKKNGIAVHAVKPLPKGESSDVPATALGDTRFLFAIPHFKGANGKEGMFDAEMEEPGEVVLTLKGQAVNPSSVTLLGDGAPLDHRFSNGVLTVVIPASRRTKLVDVVRVDLPLADCNVAWDVPSHDSFGSMPLGNGDIGINVWVEPNGDLLFYIAKVDAYDAGHLLPKLGRVRLRTDPALDTATFRQSLLLQEATVEIIAGDAKLRVWVDANAPVIRVQGHSTTPRKASLTAESLRPWKNAADALPATGTAALLFHDNSDSLAWCYRNQSSVWAAKFADQNTAEMVAKFKDPILHRTSGCVLAANGFKRTLPDSLATPQPVTDIDASVRVLTNQPPSPEAWKQEALKPVKSDWNAHLAYWKSFWNRSHIFIPKAGEGTYNLDQFRFTQFPQSRDAYEGHKEIPATLNAYQITQRYALERFCQAIASRGAVPPQFNGSLFTMDMPAGVMGFDNKKGRPVSPDGRDWSTLSFMWQNTRHPYWAMPNRGDYDTVAPGMQFVRDGLEIARDRTRKLYGIDGAVIFEASWYHNVSVFPFDGIPGHLRYHQLATVELPAIMAETYAHTRDETFLREVLLPCAEEGLKFYFSRFTKTDASGKMLMEGVGCAETYQGVTNPATEIGCMKYLLDHLLSFPIDDQRRATFTKWRAMLPEVPTRRIRGMDLLAVGDVYNPGRTDCETPELYSIYPFRQVWLGTPGKLAMARQSFHVRNVSLDGTVDMQPVETGGWQSAPVQAAYLGLAREAARLASINFHDRFIHWTGNICKGPNGEFMRGSVDAPGTIVGDPKSGLPFPYRPRAKFPAFWETKMDGTPDNDHGANSVNTLQAMLLQSHMGQIHLLPAWPEDWDVSFKLTAEQNTTVEGVYQNGRLTELKVTPESRRQDIIDHSTPEARIKALIDVACTDRNWLFNLPPMLDGLPTPGPVTGAWIETFGESVTDTRGTFWPGCTFRDHILYVHGKNPVPQIPAKVVKQSALSDSLVKIEYDQPLEPIVRAAVSAGSLTAGKSGATIDLGEAKTFDRLEFTIDIPDHKRGQARSFRLDVLQPDGKWTTAHKGNLYGIIYSKRFPPVTASQVRLTIDAPVTQFDLFQP